MHGNSSVRRGRHYFGSYSDLDNMPAVEAARELVQREVSDVTRRIEQMGEAIAEADSKRLLREREVDNALQEKTASIRLRSRLG